MASSSSSSTYSACGSFSSGLSFSVSSSTSLSDTSDSDGDSNLNSIPDFASSQRSTEVSSEGGLRVASNSGHLPVIAFGGNHNAPDDVVAEPAERLLKAQKMFDQTLIESLMDRIEAQARTLVRSDDGEMRGDDLTSFILEVAPGIGFEGIASRRSAVSLGQYLMLDARIHHVKNKLPFQDSKEALFVISDRPTVWPTGPGRTRVDAVIAKLMTRDNIENLSDITIDVEDRRDTPHHHGAITALHIVGDIMFTSSRDKTARAWNMTNLTCVGLYHGHSGEVRCLRYYEGHLYTGGADATIRKWDVLTGECVLTFRGFKHHVNVIDVSKGVLYGGSADHALMSWNTDNGERLVVYGGVMGHKKPVTCLQVAKGTILSGGADGQIKAWDARTGALRATFIGHTAVVNKLKVADNIMFSISNDNTARTWNVGPAMRPGTRGNYYSELDSSHSHTKALTCMRLVVRNRNRHRHPYILYTGSLDRSIRATFVGADGRAHHYTAAPAIASGEVHSMHIDHKYIYVGGTSSSIDVFTRKNLEHAKALNGHFNDVTVISEWNGKLVTGSMDRTLRGWDVSERKQVFYYGSQPPSPGRVRLLFYLALVALLAESLQMFSFPFIIGLPWPTTPARWVSYSILHLARDGSDGGSASGAATVDPLGLASERSASASTFWGVYWFIIGYIFFWFVLHWIRIFDAKGFFCSRKLWEGLTCLKIHWVYRAMSWLSATILFLPVANVLATSVDCTYPLPGVDGDVILDIDPSLVCWTGYHVAISLVSLIASLTFLPLALRLVSVDGLVFNVDHSEIFEWKRDSRDFSNKHMLSRRGSGFSVLFMWLKLLLVISTVTGTRYSSLLIGAYIFISILLIQLSFSVPPYFHDRGNCILSGIYFCVLWANVCGLFTLLSPYDSFTSVLLFAFTIPFFGVGYMAQAVFRTRVRRRKSATRRAYLESMLAPRTAAVAAALRSATSISSGSTSFSVDHSGISHDLSEAQTP